MYNGNTRLAQRLARLAILAILHIMTYNSRLAILHIMNMQDSFIIYSKYYKEIFRTTDYLNLHLIRALLFFKENLL